MSSLPGADRPRIMAHMVAFYPDRARSLEVARGLAEGGCSYLELQFPFSDPTADGPDIQRACSEALDAGFTVEAGFQLASEIRGFLDAPLFIMSYANLLATRGVKRFLAEAAEAGARGLIVPDLPPDYDEGLFTAAAASGLAAVPVLSPSMKEDRLRRVAALNAEYLYVTLRTGTTGKFTEIDGPGRAFLSRVSAVAGGSKVLGGFGISSADQVQAFSPLVHAVVVGSALVRVVAGGGDVGRAVRQKLEGLSEPRSATASARRA
ncbi:MAG TPA: tryptophan synthase subunit alpha [Spirochaetia bacterium]|nr:tryptophan synthase subunit alpha [Spirochaetia bacterium]